MITSHHSNGEVKSAGEITSTRDKMIDTHTWDSGDWLNYSESKLGRELNLDLTEIFLSGPYHIQGSPTADNHENLRFKELIGQRREHIMGSKPR